MKVLSCILSLAILTSCAHKPDIKGRYIHPDLQTYVDEFESFSGSYTNYPVYVADLSAKAYDGVCTEKHYYYGNEKLVQKIVVIDKTIIERFAKDYPLYIKQVVFHELAHCTYNLHYHDDSLIEDGPMQGCPKSIMHPQSSYNCFANNQAYYLAELAERLGL